MIPKKHQKIAEVKSVVALQQELKKKYKNVYVKGLCTLCKREKVITQKSFNLCVRCHRYIQSYLKRTKGYVHKKDFTEVIVEFSKPMRCRFYHICGNEVSRFNEKEMVRTNLICDQCKEIFNAGINYGVNRLKHRKIKQYE